MFKKTIFIGLFSALVGFNAAGAGISHQGSDACNRRMRSQARKFSAQVRKNLVAIAGFPLLAEWVDPKATGLIATALNIKPEDVPLLYSHPAKLYLADDSRLQLELDNWPRFQRTLISLRQPAVVQDLALAQNEFDITDEDSVSLALDTSTRLFYVVKDLGHNMELGFMMPVRDVMDTGAALPFYEIQLSILKPCLDAEICVDDLARFSTWPEQHDTH